jgi:ketosteroid isomerase-like protein
VPEQSTTVDLAAFSRAVDAFSRGDIDGIVSIYRSDAVLDLSPVGMGVFEGHEAIRGFYEDWRGSYEHFEQVIEESRDLGNGVGFGGVTAHGRLHGSPSRIELRYAAVGIWREGLVDWAANYTDIDEARAIAKRLAQERG